MRSEMSAWDPIYSSGQDCVNTDQIMANSVNCWLQFEDDFESFRQDYSFAIRAVSEILSLSKRMNDQELIKKFEQELGGYDITKIKN